MRSGLFLNTDLERAKTCAPFSLEVLGTRGGDDAGEGILGYKSSLAMAGSSARAKCRAGGLLPAFPCSCVSSIRAAKCLLQRGHPMQRPAAGQGSQMSLPEASRLSACVKAFESYRRCKPHGCACIQPLGEGFSTRVALWCIFIDQIPAGTRVPHLSSPPRSPWVPYCEPHAFCKAMVILY